MRASAKYSFFSAIAFLIAACSSKNNSSAPVANVSVSTIQSTSSERIDLVPVPSNSECPLGGIRARAWTEQGGGADTFDQASDKLLLEKTFCNTQSNIIASLTSALPDCSANGQTECTATDRFRAAALQKLTPWQVREGKTVAGITGKANFTSLMSIGAARDQTTPAMSYAQHLYSGLATKPWRLITEGLGVGYREVPKILSDDDGESGVNNHVKTVIRGTAEWNIGVPRKVCGVAASNINDKIKDCAFQHTTKPVWDAGIAGQLTWNGTQRGTNSEGSWTLVTIFAQGKNDGNVCTSQCYEVWRDDRTGMVWSDLIRDNAHDFFNWCHASGSNNSSDVNNPYREDDPVNICDNSNFQNQTQNPKPISLCFEDADWLQTPEGYDPMKGNMHKRAGASGRVKWRLPTRVDWLMAEHNGFRHVLPNSEKYYWTGTISSLFQPAAMNGAWTIDGRDGDLGDSGRGAVNSVRCIGTPDMSASNAPTLDTHGKGFFLSPTSEVSFDITVSNQPAGQLCTHGGTKIELMKSTAAAGTAAKPIVSKELCKKDPSGNAILEFTPDRCSTDGQSFCITTSDYSSFDSSTVIPFDLAQGSQIAGVRGTAFAGQFMSSGISKNKDAQAMTYAEEIYTVGVNTLLRSISSGVGFGSREIPKITLDGDFSTDGSAPHPARIERATNGTWSSGIPRRVCGKSATTVSGKIADCATQHTIKPLWDANISGRLSWDGTKSGTNSEGRWTLVTVYDPTLSDGATCTTAAGPAAGCFEVWRDDRTGLLWSDVIYSSSLPNNGTGPATSIEFTWCNATGVYSGTNLSHPYRSEDPDGVCGNSSYQNQTTPTSLCFEDPDWLNTPASTKNSKGNMHSLSGASVQVKWRVPTFRDWQIADVNGLRMILPRSIEYFWTSTIEATTRRTARMFGGLEGIFFASQRDSRARVRCVGNAEPEG